MISFKDILSKSQGAQKRVAVANPLEAEVLIALREATDLKIITPILVGNKESILELCREHKIKTNKFEFYDEEDAEKTSSICCLLVRNNTAHLLMKGQVSTATFIRACLDKTNGLRTGKLLSSVGFIETPAYPKLLGLTDGGINIAPTLEQKKEIVMNGIELLNKLGITKPKVACIAAVEKVNQKMQSTVDAYALAQMKIANAFIDGPMALDLALSKKACQMKGYISPVGGDADLLVVPNIEVGNVVYKALMYLAAPKPKSAGIVIGAQVPLITTSRADSHETRLYSIALGVIASIH